MNCSWKWIVCWKANCRIKVWLAQPTVLADHPKFYFFLQFTFSWNSLVNTWSGPSTLSSDPLKGFVLQLIQFTKVNTKCKQPKRGTNISLEHSTFNLGPDHLLQNKDWLSITSQYNIAIWPLWFYLLYQQTWVMGIWSGFYILRIERENSSSLTLTP